MLIHPQGQAEDEFHHDDDHDEPLFSDSSSSSSVSVLHELILYMMVSMLLMGGLMSKIRSLAQEKIQLRNILSSASVYSHENVILIPPYAIISPSAKSEKSDRAVAVNSKKLSSPASIPE